MLDHKRDYCKLRFTCKCDVLNEECTSCDISATDLMNINSNQGTQGDTTATDSTINVSTSSKILSEASIPTTLSTSLCKGKPPQAMFN